MKHIIAAIAAAIMVTGCLFSKKEEAPMEETAPTEMEAAPEAAPAEMEAAPAE
jgi:PBP1b-binding outer membrane lipoprotein LpoB